jgi:hypothetical protein
MEHTWNYEIAGEDFPAVILVTDKNDEGNFYESDFSFVDENTLILNSENGGEVELSKE